MEHDGAGWRAVVGYGRHIRDFWSSEINREVVKLAAPGEDDVALDVGAGMGAAVFIAARLVGRNGRVLAVEPTPFMRRSLALRRRISRQGRRVEILDGVAERLPITADLVDVAWAVNVLHHISDLDAAASELRRVMAPAGRVLLLDEDFDDPSHPEHEQMQRRHGGHIHHGGDHHHDTDQDGHHHLMVDIEALSETMASYGFVSIDPRAESIAGVPTNVVTASVPASS